MYAGRRDVKSDEVDDGLSGAHRACRPTRMVLDSETSEGGVVSLDAELGSTRPTVKRRRFTPKKRRLDGSLTSVIALMRALPLDDNGCQIWPAGAANNNGYGRFNVRIDGRQRGILAHRASLAAHLGRELTGAEEVMHSCDVPRCVNPDHLKIGTHRENMQDMMRKGRGGGFAAPKPSNERMT